jgi:hypothetical protein
VIEFEAIIPPLQSAVSVSGDGGARIKLDVADDQIDAVVRLLALRGQVLKVRIEAE